jgi:hypothetical protein
MEKSGKRYRLLVGAHHSHAALTIALFEEDEAEKSESGGFRHGKPAVMCARSGRIPLKQPIEVRMGNPD